MTKDKPTNLLRVCRVCRRGNVKDRKLGVWKWSPLPDCFKLGQGVLQVQVVCPDCQRVKEAA